MNKDKCRCDSRKTIKQEIFNKSCPWNLSICVFKSNNYTENALDNLILNGTTINTSLSSKNIYIFLLMLVWLAIILCVNVV